MKIYQLKTRVDREDVVTIATYLNQQDAFDALADWSDNENLLQSKYDHMTIEQQENFQEEIQDKIPLIYNTYEGVAHIEEIDVLDAYDPKSLDLDFKLLGL